MGNRLVVIGAINTDLVINAPHLPAPGETVVGGGLQTYGGGKAANAAVAAARAGAEVLLIGAVGDDDAGKAALASLQHDDVDTSGVAILNGTPTGAALIVVDANGENQIAIGPGANGAISAAHVETALTDALPDASTVLVSTEIPLACVVTAVAMATARGVRCILNPAPVIPDLDSVLAYGPLVTPNELELRELVGGDSDNGDVAMWLTQAHERASAPAIVTLGSRGCAACLSDGSLIRIPALAPAVVVDTTGAGDTFNGVFATHLASGSAIEQALAAATAAASLSVARNGARGGMPGAEAIAQALAASALAAAPFD